MFQNLTPAPIALQIHVQSIPDTLLAGAELFKVPNPHVDCGLTVDVGGGVGVQYGPNRFQQNLDDCKYGSPAADLNQEMYQPISHEPDSTDILDSLRSVI